MGPSASSPCQSLRNAPACFSDPTPDTIGASYGDIAKAAARSRQFPANIALDMAMRIVPTQTRLNCSGHSLARTVARLILAQILTFGVVALPPVSHRESWLESIRQRIHPIGYEFAYFGAGFGGDAGGGIGGECDRADG